MEKREREHKIDNSNHNTWARKFNSIFDALYAQRIVCMCGWMRVCAARAHITNPINKRDAIKHKISCWCFFCCWIVIHSRYVSAGSSQLRRVDVRARMYVFMWFGRDKRKRDSDRNKQNVHECLWFVWVCVRMHVSVLYLCFVRTFSFVGKCSKLFYSMGIVLGKGISASTTATSTIHW